jgi:phytoene synthase
LDAVAAQSREIIRKGSKSFAAAARLFDAETRADVYKLYAWCRYCDDLIDGQEMGFGREEISAAEARSRLAYLRAQTERALAGEDVAEVAFAGLRDVAGRHKIPGRYPMDLIHGFAMDVEGHAYVELEDTLLYCYHVAGVVGVMMAYVMGAREPAVLGRAADLGIAFQLTNISRDVLDDATNGRVYLPGRWLEEADISADQVAMPAHREAVFAVVSRLLELADLYYESAAQGVPALGFRAGWAVSTAAGVYGDIGRLVAERGTSAWDTRAIVPGGRKLWWGVRGGAQALMAVSFGRWRGDQPRSPDLWIKPDLC